MNNMHAVVSSCSPLHAQPANNRMQSHSHQKQQLYKTTSSIKITVFLAYAQLEETA